MSKINWRRAANNFDPAAGDNAWTPIRRVRRPEGWNACDCGRPLQENKQSIVPTTVTRLVCTHCGQRYDVTPAPPEEAYPGFGSF